MAGIPAVIEEDDGTTTICYYREPNGALIARRMGATGTNWSYYHFDELGSTRALTDEDGEVTDTYTYDAWGNASHDSGSTEQPYQYVGELGYYTHYQDSGFGLLQLGVRFYDPEIGRFTQRDPIPNFQESTYSYASNTPTAEVDPSGLSPMVCQAVLKPIPLRAGTSLTKAMCRAGCAAAFRVGSKGYKICLAVCKELNGATCEALWAFCEHLGRHARKQASEACYACYNAIPECAG